MEGLFAETGDSLIGHHHQSGSGGFAVACGLNERTVCAYAKEFNSNICSFKETQQGKHEGSKSTMILKFHCELKPIERVWGQAK